MTSMKSLPQKHAKIHHAVYAPPDDHDDRETYCAYYQTVRTETALLAEPLSSEDQTVQTMPDVSPTKWHLAHTSWFFETFLLKPFLRGYQEYDPAYAYLFNSYYEQLGAQYPRPQRGFLSRPSLQNIHAYRDHVDRAMGLLIEETPSQEWKKMAHLITLGLHHEQQHQELILTDIKHVLAQNPLFPAAYASTPSATMRASPPPKPQWIDFEGGLFTIGSEREGSSAFAFDNEGPQHECFLQPFALANRLITNGEYLEFIEDKGYERAEFWLSDGWAHRAAEGWQAPLYWLRSEDGGFDEYTLRGREPLQENSPVLHVSYYEASAYACWAGKRLSRENEYEALAANRPLEGHFGHRFSKGMPLAPHPQGLSSDAEALSCHQLYGDLWEWTMSPYSPYPGFQTQKGAIGEYNGKFMCNQFVLKGGSCATPKGHLRASYRNFFPPHARWQFSGIRLAQDA